MVTHPEWFDAAMASPSAPVTVFWATLASTWVVGLGRCYVSLRQMRVLATRTSMPIELFAITNSLKFDYTRLYAIDSTKLDIVKELSRLAVDSLALWLYRIFWNLAGSACAGSVCDGSEMARTVVFAILYLTFDVMVELPADAYRNFVLMRRHTFYAFKKLTLVVFGKLQISKLVGVLAKTIFFGAGIAFISQATGEYISLYLWLLASAVACSKMLLYPYIAPLLGWFTPLPEGDLRTQVEALVASVGFPFHKICVERESEGSPCHGGAYLTGFSWFERIVLSERLLERCTVPEVLAVTAHELGHWKRNHVAKKVPAIVACIWLVSALFAALYRQPALYEAFGFASDERPAVVGYVLFVNASKPLVALLRMAVLWLSRRFQFEADAFAVELGRGDDLAAFLGKATSAFPISDKLYSVVYRSHPSLLERWEAIVEAEGKRA